MRRVKRKSIYRAHPEYACNDRFTWPEQRKPSSTGHVADPQYTPRVIQVDNAYLIGDMMHSVIQYSAGRATLKLQRRELSGKTGTTNQPDRRPV